MRPATGPRGLRAVDERRVPGSPRGVLGRRRLQHLIVSRSRPSRTASSTLALGSVASGTLHEVPPNYTSTCPSFLASALISVRSSWPSGVMRVVLQYGERRSSVPGAILRRS